MQNPVNPPDHLNLYIGAFYQAPMYKFSNLIISWLENTVLGVFIYIHTCFEMGPVIMS